MNLLVLQVLKITKRIESMQVTSEKDRSTLMRLIDKRRQLMRFLGTVSVEDYNTVKKLIQ
jgi:ribosomal protein S15P/S13E